MQRLYWKQFFCSCTQYRTQCSAVFIVFLGAATIFTTSLSAQTALQKAQEYYTAKEYPTALPLAQTAVGENPRDIAALLLLGDIYDALDRADSALVYYQKAQDVDYWKPEVMRHVALGLSATGKHNEALKKAEELTRSYPKEAENFLVLSRVYVEGNGSASFPKNALTKADAAVIKAQSINKNLPATYVARGDIYFSQRVYELAKDNYLEALKRDSTLLESRSKLAESYFRLANIPYTSKKDNIRLVNLSLQEWDKVTKSDTNNAKAFFNKGKIQFLAKQYAQVIPTYQRYLQLRPDAALVRWNLAQAAYTLLETEKKEYDTALVKNLELSKKAIDSIADKADMMIAKTLLYKREFTASVAKFAEIKANKGLKADDIELFARAAINAGDTATAVREYKDFFEKYPDDCKLMMSVGTALYAWRQYDDAIDIFRKRVSSKACSADKASANAYYYIGAAYFSKNMLDSALPALQKSLALDPKALYVRSLFANTFMEQKKYKEAKAEYLTILTMGKADTSKGKREVEAAVNVLCRIANTGKRWAELKKYAAEWTALNEHNPFGWFYAAIAEQNLNNLPQSCALYKETIARLKAAAEPNTKLIGDLETQLEALHCSDSTATSETTTRKKKSRSRR